MTAPRWPAPGTTYGPDRLDEVRALLRAWPGRGVWIRYSELGSAEGHGWFYDNVANGDCWHYVGPHPSDPPDTQPAEPEPARTVVATMWAFVWADDDGRKFTFVRTTRGLAEMARRDVIGGTVLTDVHEVRAALPLPVEPAVVVGTVFSKEVSDGEA